MKITDIRIRSVESALDNSSKFKAVASITIDECFVIHDIKIIEGDDSAFIAMPSRKPNREITEISFTPSTQKHVITYNRKSFPNTKKPAQCKTNPRPSP